MAHVSIRYNKLKRHLPNETPDHVWRVFVDGQEKLCKHFRLEVVAYSERIGDDWNVACDGFVTFDRETSTVVIRGQP